jgi:hypothetical protein
MKRKLLLGTVAGVTLVAATTATAFAATSPAPAPKQAHQVSAAAVKAVPAKGVAKPAPGQLKTVPATAGTAHASSGLVLKATAASGKAEVVLARPVRAGQVTAIAASPGKTLPSQAQPKVVLAK